MTTPSDPVRPEVMQDAYRDKLSLDKTRTNTVADEFKPSLSNIPKPGTKRLFSNRDSTLDPELHRDENSYHEVDLHLLSPADSDEHFESCDDAAFGRQPVEKCGLNGSMEKRHRTSDWPLKNKTECEVIPSGPHPALRGRHGPLNFAASQRRAISQPRPSKFIEGSMNDRISQKPQQLYIGESEEPLNLSEARHIIGGNDEGEVQLEGLHYYSNPSEPLSLGGDKSEAPRQSTIFRFGKSLAAAFNPSSWKIWPKTRDEEDAQEQTAWNERRDKAERAYKGLKQTKLSGQSINYSNGLPHKMHDSGVELNNRNSSDGMAPHNLSKALRTPADEKRYGRVFLDPPSVSSLGRSESPSYESVGASRNSSFPVHRPLAQTNDLENRPQILRRLPSRKDLQKQQKLVKRVSDLEGRLEAARRQLAEALGQPVPNQASVVGRQRFTPNVLASLPSEGLLSAYAAANSGAGGLEESNGVGMAVSTDNEIPHPNSSDNAGRPDFKGSLHASSTNAGGLSLQPTLADSNTLLGSNVSQLVKMQYVEDAEAGRVEHAMQSAQGSNTVLDSGKESRMKRKSIGLGIADDSGTYQAPQDTDGEDSYEATKPSPPKRKPGRPRKLKKADPESRLHTGEVSSFEKSGVIPNMNSPQSSRGRKRLSSANHRATPSRKTALAANHTRIPRKGNQSKSPDPPSSSTIKKIVGEEEQASPAGPRAGGMEPAGVPNRQVQPNEHGGVVVHVREHMEAGKPAVVPHQCHADGMQSFEWPEDVF